MMTHPTEADVVIVGAGPVGLLLAGLLGKNGISVIVLEAATTEINRSMAIGITPPSLEILAKLGHLDLYASNNDRFLKIDFSAGP